MIQNFDNTVNEILAHASAYSDIGLSAGEKAGFWGRVGAVVRAHDARRDGDLAAFVDIADIVLGPYPGVDEVARVVNTTRPAWRESLCATPITHSALSAAHAAYAAYATWRAAYALSAERGVRVAPPSWRAVIRHALCWSEAAYDASNRSDVSTLDVPSVDVPLGTELVARIVAGETSVLIVGEDGRAHGFLNLCGDWTIVPDSDAPLYLPREAAEEALDALNKHLSR